MYFGDNAFPSEIGRRIVMRHHWVNLLSSGDSGTMFESELFSCWAAVEPNYNLVWHSRSTTSKLGLLELSLFENKDNSNSYLHISSQNKLEVLSVTVQSHYIPNSFDRYRKIATDWLRTIGLELAASLISNTGNWPNGLLPAKREQANLKLKIKIN